ncbi:ROK family protein [Aquamicrobium sp. LC103]|uniref:ROK family protein n=1 Tax=Aquamicrobium sp. LC103 TaxID=1120658 RepID=UPI00063EB020|nr:ROK family protein [Aquamicrobium sp. LC103]TKT75327.1 ROK family protein [Aquamicrobium sp. LC103]
MTIGVRHDDLRKRNRAMVIAAVRRSGQPSRTEIASATELSHSTISAISSDLINEGILAEAKSEATATKRGRPQVGLCLNPDAGVVLAIVLSLNSLSATMIDYSGTAIAQDISRPATLSMGKAELIEVVLAAARRLIERPDLAEKRLLRIALGIQGITDSDARRLMWTPITPEGDIDFADALEEAFGIPVTVQNDCNMIAVALRNRAPERYSDNFIAVLLSNGIGMGLVLRGELFTGSHSSGGEFGHMIHMPDGALCRCGRLGCIEAYAGNYAIFRHARGEGERAKPAADIDDATMLALAAAARDHEGRERDAFHKAGEAIGFGLGSLFALIDPAPVAIVGLGASAFDIIEPSIREAIAKTAGGQHNAAISFDLEPDEAPLIREGCARQALTFVDQEIFAPGQAMQALAGREVA